MSCSARSLLLGGGAPCSDDGSTSPIVGGLANGSTSLLSPSSCADEFVRAIERPAAQLFCQGRTFLSFWAFCLLSAHIDLLYHSRNKNFLLSVHVYLLSFLRLHVSQLSQSTVYAAAPWLFISLPDEGNAPGIL